MSDGIVVLYLRHGADTVRLDRDVPRSSLGGDEWEPCAVVHLDASTAKPWTPHPVDLQRIVFDGATAGIPAVEQVLWRIYDKHGLVPWLLAEGPFSAEARQLRLKWQAEVRLREQGLKRIQRGEKSN